MKIRPILTISIREPHKNDYIADVRKHIFAILYCPLDRQRR